MAMPSLTSMVIPLNSDGTETEDIITPTIYYSKIFNNNGFFDYLKDKYKLLCTEIFDNNGKIIIISYYDSYFDPDENKIYNINKEDLVNRMSKDKSFNKYVNIRYEKREYTSYISLEIYKDILEKFDTYCKVLFRKN